MRNEQLSEEQLDYIEKYYLIKPDEDISKEIKVSIAKIKNTRYKYGWKKQRQTSNKNLFNEKGEKWCWYCNTYHELSWFNKNKNKPSGYQDECRIAQKQINIERKLKKTERNIKTKVCEECGQELSSEMFIKNVSTQDGYSNKCKECLNKDLKRKFKVK
ncbi:hypothetical protein [Clostridium botulinum]|uniref:hypothetical protein n=1 Tax=Clostridium botulinum TaxID=1491 RepID=UPI001C9B68F6|nr:hypothetical protein [Clostridium botulinum]MBY6838681.1 hypothetical protein [Clostridium botulinum]